jgi:small-conductance mechanosensitive channel
MSIYQWHTILITAIAYTLWELIARRRLRSQEYVNAGLNYINFFVAFSFGVLIIACLLYFRDHVDLQKPKSLLELCFLIWTGTVCSILWFTNLSKWVKVLSGALVIMTPLIHYSYSQGLTGFLATLDDFIKLGGGSFGTGLRLSVFLMWLFFFTHSFITLHYYGRIYEISHRDKIRRGIKREGLQEDAIERAIVVITMSLSFFIALVLIGTDIGKLSLFSGLVAAGVSIALRDLLANMAAGILLLWDKSIKLKDVVALDKDRYGVVKSMTLRYLILEDRNDIRFLIPNSDLINTTITNWTQTTRKIRLKLNFGVSYESDIEKVKDIIKAVCLRNSRVLQDPAPKVLILGLGDSTIDFQLRFFIEDPENGIRNVMGELYELLIERFRDAKISVPFPQREIRLLPTSTLNIRSMDQVEDDRKYKNNQNDGAKRKQRSSKRQQSTSTQVQHRPYK